MGCLRKLRSKRRAEEDGDIGIRGFINGKAMRVVNNCIPTIRIFCQPRFVIVKINDSLVAWDYTKNTSSYTSIHKHQQYRGKGLDHTVTTAQALNVVLEPNLFRQALAMKGKATPAMLFAAHIVPSARPLRRKNHWSRYKEDGLNKSPFPIAQMTPWVAIKCHTCSENEDNRDPITVMTRPAGAE